MIIKGCLQSDIAFLTGLFGEVKKAVTVNVIFEKTKRTEYIDRLCRLTKEKFILETKGNVINLYCSHRRGMLYGLYEISQKPQADGITEGYPLFKTRGYIEGFYGTPWSADQRESMLRLMSEKRMNTVYYAPKDDSFHREKWREEYPPQELEKLRSLVTLSKQSELDFYYCIAPGLSICYSDGLDFLALKNKLSQLYSIGVRGFGLLLDDISDELSHESDRAQFCETVNAHISLINRCRDFLYTLDSETTLTVCPTLYHGMGNEYYISKLGREIASDISIFWTGRDICSREQTVSEALRFFEATRHKPLYWDNYPVNDCAMYAEMHAGPLTGRDAELYKYSEGIIFNCMEYAECSKIPLRTCADYLWDSEAYNPEASFYEAVEKETGDSTLMYFFDHLRFSCLRDENSPLMCRAFSEPEKIGVYFRSLEHCRSALKNETPLFNELRAWIEKFDLFCCIVGLIPRVVDEVSKGGVSEETRRPLFELIEKYDSNPRSLAKLNIRQELSAIFGRDVL